MTGILNRIYYDNTLIMFKYTLFNIYFIYKHQITNLHTHWDNSQSFLYLSIYVNVSGA